MTNDIITAIAESSLKHKNKDMHCTRQPMKNKNPVVKLATEIERAADVESQMRNMNAMQMPDFIAWFLPKTLENGYQYH